MEKELLAKIQNEPENLSSHLQVYQDLLIDQQDQRYRLVENCLKIRQFPEGVIHHTAGFDAINHIEIVRQFLIDNDASWLRAICLPYVGVDIEFSDVLGKWWMWKEEHPPSYLEIDRQVEFLNSGLTQQSLMYYLGTLYRWNGEYWNRTFNLENGIYQYLTPIQIRCQNQSWELHSFPLSMSEVRVSVQTDIAEVGSAISVTGRTCTSAKITDLLEMLDGEHDVPGT